MIGSANEIKFGGDVLVDSWYCAEIFLVATGDASAPYGSAISAQRQTVIFSEKK